MNPVQLVFYVSSHLTIVGLMFALTGETVFAFHCFGGAIYSCSQVQRWL